MQETINPNDYLISYDGNLTDIKSTDKILALYINGYGFGSYDDYRGSSTYYFYKFDKFGKLNKIGEGHGNQVGYDISCDVTINGQKAIFDGIFIENIFTSIFKKA